MLYCSLSKALWVWISVCKAITPVVVWSHWQTQVGHYACILSHVRLFAIPWTVARQAPLSMGFSRQEYWSGLPFSPPGESSQPRDQTLLAGRFLMTELPGKPNWALPMNNYQPRAMKTSAGTRIVPGEECLLIPLAQGCLLGFLLSALLLSFLTFVPGCTLSLFHTPFSLSFFLLIPYSSSLPFSLRTFQFSLLDMVPQPECWFACLSRFECHVGGGEQQWNERNIPHEFLFQLCTGFAEIKPRGSQIGTRQKHQLMDLIRIKLQTVQWLRLCTPSAGAQVRSLVKELDPTCSN